MDVVLPHRSQVLLIAPALDVVGERLGQIVCHAGTLVLPGDGDGQQVGEVLWSLARRWLLSTPPTSVHGAAHTPTRDGPHRGGGERRECDAPAVVSAEGLHPPRECLGRAAEYETHRVAVVDRHETPGAPLEIGTVERAQQPLGEVRGRVVTAVDRLVGTRDVGQIFGLHRANGRHGSLRVGVVGRSRDFLAPRYD
jgi:hypothetical protein